MALVPLQDLVVDPKRLLYQYGTPDILIGVDFCYDLEVRLLQILSSEFTVHEFLLGFIIASRSETELVSSFPNIAVTNFVNNFSYKSFDNCLSQFFFFQTLGIKEELPETLNMDKYKKQICFVNDRYEVPLPWKSCSLLLSSNYKRSTGKNSLVLNLIRLCTLVY